MGSNQKNPQVSRRFLLCTLLVGVTAASLILSNRLAIYDWIRLHNYHPSSALAQLATDDTMTTYGRKIFYVNHPQIDSKSAFAPHCPSGTEQTVVLGCYQTDQAGIYLLNVSDPRLQGIEQVTAAHETLHAAYDRLSSSQKSSLDVMLVDYYNHGLTDPVIKNIIAAYKQTEPHDVVNEMHSVFGTEVGNLPAPLEAHYKKYFTNRAAIVADYTRYEAAFTSRQTTIVQDDAQLAVWKSQIADDQADLKTRQADISAQQTSLDNERSSGDTTDYNAGVPAYNQHIAAYNAEIQTVQTLDNQYNQLVASRNQLALEEQQLTQDISSSLPATK